MPSHSNSTVKIDDCVFSTGMPNKSINRGDGCASDNVSIIGTVGGVLISLPLVKMHSHMLRLVIVSIRDGVAQSAHA